MYNSVLLKKIIPLKRKKWVVIGTGNMASTYTQILQSSFNANVIGVVSRDISKAKKFSKKYCIMYSYTNVDDLIRKINYNLDYIYIASPTFTHYKLILELLNYGVNIVCEKPIVTNINEFKTLESIMVNKTHFIVEALWSNYLPTINKAEDWIENDKIGKISNIKINLCKKIDDKKVNSSYRNEDKLGIFSDFGIYPFAFLANFIAVLPDDVNKTIIYDTYGISEVQLSFCSYNIKIDIVISSLKNSENKAYIYGDLGHIEFSSPFNRTNHVKLFNKHRMIVEDLKYLYVYDGYEFIIKKLNSSKSRNLVQLLDIQMAKTKFSLQLLDKVINYE